MQVPVGSEEPGLVVFGAGLGFFERGRGGHGILGFFAGQGLLDREDLETGILVAGPCRRSRGCSPTSTPVTMSPQRPHDITPTSRFRAKPYTTDKEETQRPPEGYPSVGSGVAGPDVQSCKGKTAGMANQARGGTRDPCSLRGSLSLRPARGQGSAPAAVTGLLLRPCPTANLRRSCLRTRRKPLRPIPRARDRAMQAARCRDSSASVA